MRNMTFGIEWLGTRKPRIEKIKYPAPTDFQGHTFRRDQDFQAQPYSALGRTWEDRVFVIVPEPAEARCRESLDTRCHCSPKRGSRKTHHDVALRRWCGMNQSGERIWVGRRMENADTMCCHHWALSRLCGCKFTEDV